MKNTMSSFPVKKAVVAAAFLCSLTVEASAHLVYALVTLNQIIAFDSNNPSSYLLNTAVPNLQVDEQVYSIDTRPATGELIAITSKRRTLRIDPDFTANTVTATAIASPFDPITATGNRVGIDISPVADRIRITTDGGTNFRVNPNTGAIAGIDTDLNPVGNIVEIAYDRNFPNLQATTLLGIDSNSNTLVRIGGVDGSPSPNGGQVTTVGPVNFDFGPNSALESAESELYAILDAAGETRFCRMVPETGFVFGYSPLPGNPPVTGMAVAFDPVDAIKLRLKMNFADVQKGKLQIKGLIPIPGGFNVDGKLIRVNIGGHHRAYVVDEKGKAALGSDKISLKVKSKNGVVAAQMAKLSVKFVGNFAPALADEGLVDGDFKNEPREVIVSIKYGDETAQVQVPVLYTAKTGKSGKARN